MYIASCTCVVSVQACTCTFTHMHMCTHMRTCTHTHTHTTCACTHTHTHTHTCACIHTHVHACIHLAMQVHILYILIYIGTFESGENPEIRRAKGFIKDLFVVSTSLCSYSYNSYKHQFSPLYACMHVAK